MNISVAILVQNIQLELYIYNPWCSKIWELPGIGGNVLLKNAEWGAKNVLEKRRGSKSECRKEN